MIEIKDMVKTVHIVFIYDLVDYPPALTVINVLLKMGVNVTYIGFYSDVLQKKQLSEKGVRFVDVHRYFPKGGIFQKITSVFQFKHDVLHYFKHTTINNDDIIWIMNIETINIVSALLKNHKCVLHLFEFTDSNASWRYKLANPFFDFRESLHSAYKIIHCEYNRAMITKGLYGLECPPIVLPNKPFEIETPSIPHRIKDKINAFEEKTKGKKVVLYQGIFDSKERRLEEFCQAVSYLPEDYVFVAMGRGDDYYEKLKKQYSSDRILFIPFVEPPYHLLITQKAFIGVLSYFPVSENYADVINPLYCAPNKIFEYAKFGIPMIANDVPGLHFIFQQYNCGLCVSYPITAQKISDAILGIADNKIMCSVGARNYYDSVNPEEIISSILND